MVYGEEHLKMQYLSAGSGPGRADASPPIGSFEGVARPTATVPGLIAQAAETQKFAADRLAAIDGLASRAVDIATRLAGSFPSPGPERDAVRAGEQVGPSSALDALQRTIADIRHPLRAMDDPFNRLVCALDALDGALR